MRQHASNKLLGDVVQIKCGMVVNSGGVIMGECIAGGSKRTLEVFIMKNGDAIQVRNVAWTKRDIEAMQKDEENIPNEEEEISGIDDDGKRVVKKMQKQVPNTYAVFRVHALNAAVAVNDRMDLLKNQAYWTTIYRITFRFMERPDNSNCQNREVVMYDEHSLKHIQRDGLCEIHEVQTCIVVAHPH